MSWIESHQELAQHPKTRRLARMLGVSVPTVIGHLHMLWWWALDYADDGNLDRYSIEDLADAVLWEGEASTLIDAMVLCQFVDRGGDGSMMVHNWNGGRWSIKLRSERRREWEAMASHMRPRVFERDKGACLNCGSFDLLEVDHIIPLALGGTNEWDNLQTLCRSCNRSKGAN